MEFLIPISAGALGAFLRMLLSQKGIILLPSWEHKDSRHVLNLGFLSPILIGAIVGWIVPYALGADALLSFTTAYSSGHAIEHIIERFNKWQK